jgi:8-oxo-dGTP diphosphatase
MKKAVCLLLPHENDHNLFLSISRKSDQTKFGFLGGKVEDGETELEAIAREVLEEAGLILTNAQVIFSMICDGTTPYDTTCFVGTVAGEIKAEAGSVVKWCTKEELMAGPFGSYNTALFRKLGLIDDAAAHFTMKDRYCSYCGQLHVSTAYPKICSFCKSFTWKNPLPVAVAVIPIKEGGFVFTRRNIEPDKGSLCFACGYIENNETWEEALIREVKEEVGIVVSKVKLLTVVSSSSSSILIFGKTNPVPKDKIDWSFKNEETQELVYQPSEDEILWTTHRKVYHELTNGK